MKSINFLALLPILKCKRKKKLKCGAQDVCGKWKKSLSTPYEKRNWVDRTGMSWWLECSDGSFYLPIKVLSITPKLWTPLCHLDVRQRNKKIRNQFKTFFSLINSTSIDACVRFSSLSMKNSLGCDSTGEFTLEHMQQIS